MTVAQPFFDVPSEPPPVGSTDFSLYYWNEIRDSGISPQFHSGYHEDLETRLDFLEGCRLMGYDVVAPGTEAAHLAANPGRFVIYPQQLQVVDTLGAGQDSNVVEIPRRASKTTTIFTLLIGRCSRRPNQKVTFSAQNGVAGSRRLREWAARLDLINPPDDLDLPPWMRNQPRRPTKAAQRQSSLFDLDAGDAGTPAGRGFRILKGEVGKGIYFDNGSTFLVLKPDADAYRGEAADVSWLDEFQEVPPDEGDDLLAGILPLQDTRPGSSIIMSGTAGEVRVGAFWTYVDRGRNMDPDVAIIDYAAPENTAWEIIEDEDAAIALLLTVHPGVGTLTTEAKMRKNWRGMAKPQWAREYLSVWPETFGVAVIPAAAWSDAATGKKAIPARVAFGMDIRPGGSAAAICAAWRDAAGVAYVEVVAHRSGTVWMPAFASALSEKHKGSTVAYDDIGEGRATATELAAHRPKPRLRVQTYRDQAAGCVQLLRDLDRGRLHHFGQVSLDEAVNVAGKREVRGDTGVWLWTNAAEGDISPLVAATRALREWDMHYATTGTARKPVLPR